MEIQTFRGNFGQEQNTCNPEPPQNIEEAASYPLLACSRTERNDNSMEISSTHGNDRFESG